MPSCFGPPTPTRARRPFDASVDPTEARNDILGCFGQSTEGRCVKYGFPVADFASG
jgi:hypothetical protein